MLIRARGNLNLLITCMLLKIKLRVCSEHWATRLSHHIKIIEISQMLKRTQHALPTRLQTLNHIEFF